MNDQRLTERSHTNALMRGEALYLRSEFTDYPWDKQSPEMRMAWVALAENIRANEIAEMRLEHDQERNSAMYDLSNSVQSGLERN